MASAYQLTHNAEEAKDLTQEAFIDAYQRLGQLRDRDKFRCWLFTILRHKCHHYLRQKQRHEISLEVCAEIPTTPREYADEEITDLLACLPLADREILAARYLYELDYSDVAQVLGINIHAAYVRCSARARTLARHAAADG